MFINIEFHHVDPFLSFQLHPKLEAFIIFALWHWVSKHVFLQWFQWPLDPRNPEKCCGPRQQDPDPEIGQRISTSVASSFHRCHVGQTQNQCQATIWGWFIPPMKILGIVFKIGFISLYESKLNDIYIYTYYIILYYMSNRQDLL